MSGLPLSRRVHVAALRFWSGGRCCGYWCLVCYYATLHTATARASAARALRAEQGEMRDENTFQIKKKTQISWVRIRL